MTTFCTSEKTEGYKQIFPMSTISRLINIKYIHASENLGHSDPVYSFSQHFTFFSVTEVSKSANQSLMNAMETLARQEELLRLPETVLYFLFCHS
jgi:hypothetical protein